MSFWSKHSYQKKYFLLVGGFLIFCLFIYFFSIRKTLTLIDKCENDQEIIDKATYQGKELTLLMNKLEAYNQQIGSNQTIHTHQFQQELLRSITDYCSTNQMVIERFEQPHKVKQGAYWVETTVVSVEGYFKPILELIYYLETKVVGKKITSIQFEKTKNYKTKREKLTAVLYIQNVKKDKE